MFTSTMYAITLADHLAAYLAPSPGHKSPSVRVVGNFLLVKMMTELEGPPLVLVMKVVGIFPLGGVPLERTLRSVGVVPLVMVVVTICVVVKTCLSVTIFN